MIYTYNRNSNKCYIDNDKKNSIGAIQRKSKFLPPYKNLAFPELGWKTETNFAFAQGKAGVYIIKKDGVIVYIGAGNNVYKTMLRHFEAHKGDGHNKQDFYSDYEKHDYRVRIILTNTRDQAARLEAALIQKYKPFYNSYIPEMFDRKTEKIVSEYEEEAPF